MLQSQTYNTSFTWGLQNVSTLIKNMMYLLDINTFIAVGQNPILANSDLLITFLFSAQQETHNVQMHEVEIEISLMNGYRIPLSVSSTDSSSTILDIACNYLNLPKELSKYFSLYLFNWSCAKDGQPSLKKLEEYESPYISQKYVRPDDKIVLRKR